MQAMRAMVLDEPGRPLQARELPDPELEPGRPGDVLVEVHACGVCRTDLHIRDGEVRGSRLPVVPGHQIVGTVLAAGPDAEHAPGARVGVPWLGWTDGDVPLLPQRAREPLRARAVHRPRHRRRLRRARGGRRALLPSPLPDGLRRPRGRAAAVRRADRPPRAAHDGRRASASGSTASAPRRTSSARSPLHQGRRVFAFTRAGDEAAQALRARARLRVGRRRDAARRRSSSTRRSSSPRSASSCPAALRARRAAAGSSCAPAST